MDVGYFPKHVSGELNSQLGIKANCQGFELALIRKFICVCSGSRWCAQWARNLYWFGLNVPTFSLWWLTLLTPCCSMLTVGVTSR